MAVGTTARSYHTAQIHYLRKDFTFADDGSTLTVGIIPANATIIKPISGVNVDVAFNAGTTNVLDIGHADSTADPDYYATNLALGSIAFVAIDEAVDVTHTADRTITASVDLTGTAATAGTGQVVIAFVLSDA